MPKDSLKDLIEEARTRANWLARNLDKLDPDPSKDPQAGSTLLRRLADVLEKFL